MKKAVAVVVLVAIAFAIGGWWVAFRQGASVSVAAADIRAIEFAPFPEGPSQPGFAGGVPDRFHVPIQLVAGAIPSPLPGPLRLRDLL